MKSAILTITDPGIPLEYKGCFIFGIIDAHDVLFQRIIEKKVRINL